MDVLAPSPELIQKHLPCLSCGYDLFATSRSGLCPECGSDVTRSVAMAFVLLEPANAARARRMSGSLLLSSIFAGLCPAACLLALNLENLVGAIAMTVAFATCAIFAALGERRRREIVNSDSFSMASGSPIGFDIIAAVGLLLVNVAGYFYGLQNSLRAVWYSFHAYEAIAMTCVGVGFFLLFIAAWRALPTWRAQADFARQLHGLKLENLMRFLAWTKAIYETAWLFCCWSPFALISLGSQGEDLAIPLAVAAAFGLIGFAVIWILMIIAHAILHVQIRKVTIG